MTDDTGEEEEATPPGWVNSGWPSPPETPPVSPPVWATKPESWPPPAPGPTIPIAPPPGPVTPPSMPAPGPGWGSGGGGWNSGYTDMWSPPPDAPRPGNAARRVVATIAVVTLVLASGAVGAIISAAVHGNPSTPAVSSPSFGGPDDNGLGLGSGNSSNGNSGSSGASSAITSKVNPALVNIYTTIDTGASTGEAAGTGMVITSSGEVLTNNHVIADSKTVNVVLVSSPNSTHTAKVLGYDVKDDVALLQIDGVSNLDTVSFADATKVAIGDPVVAIGNAGGRGTPAASSGAVTALDQKVTAGDQGSGTSETLAGMIEISAPIEPGDSGGPLVNSKGQVIGMNTAAATNDRFSGFGGSSTAFAIPINRAIQLVHQMEAAQDSANVHIGQRGLLGIRVEDIATQLTCDTVPANTGALVAGVTSGSPASDAGLSKCDVIVEVGGKRVASTSDLNAVMFPYHPGEKVPVSWVDQSGSTRRASVSLITGPPV